MTTLIAPRSWLADMREIKSVVVRWRGLDRPLRQWMNRLLAQRLNMPWSHTACGRRSRQRSSWREASSREWGQWPSDAKASSVAEAMEDGMEDGLEDTSEGRQPPFGSIKRIPTSGKVRRKGGKRG